MYQARRFVAFAYVGLLYQYKLMFADNTPDGLLALLTGQDLTE